MNCAPTGRFFAILDAMASYSYQKHDLPNGIRVRAVHVPGSPTVTFGVLVGAGSRHETDDEAGIAHFIEHNVFKGTTKRPSSQFISDAIESVGGIHNAFTGMEYTGFWAKAESHQLPTLLDVVSDLFLNPLFPEKDLDIERGNVIEELNMYEDMPQYKVDDVFSTLLFPNHPLGRKIVGTKETLKSFKRENLMAFRSRAYDPRHIVVIAAGDFDVSDYFRHCEALFGNFASAANLETTLFKTPVTGSQVVVIPRKLDQAHLVMGFYGLAQNDEREEILAVGNEILGGSRSLSSRLFYRIREKLGLAYYVHSDDQSLEEIGIWAVAAGVTTSKLGEAIRAILDEFTKIATEPVTNEELARAKAHLKGQLAFSLETSNGLWNFFGMQELVKNKVETPEEVAAKIDSVTKEDIEKLSKELVRKDRLSLAVLGDFDKEKTEAELRGQILKC